MQPLVYAEPPIRTPVRGLEIGANRAFRQSHDFKKIETTGLAPIFELSMANRDAHDHGQLLSGIILLGYEQPSECGERRPVTTDLNEKDRPVLY